MVGELKVQSMTERGDVGGEGRDWSWVRVGEARSGILCARVILVIATVLIVILVIVLQLLVVVVVVIQEV